MKNKNVHCGNNKILICKNFYMLANMGLFKIKRPFFILLLLIHMSCHSSDKVMIQSGTICFDTKINYFPSSISLIHDSLNQDLICLVDLPSSKWIKIFDLKGNLVKALSLDSIVSELGQIGNINFEFPGLILFQKKFANYFILTDLSLRVIKRINLGLKIKDNNGNYFEIVGLNDLSYCNKLRDSNLYFFIYPEQLNLKRETKNFFFDYFKLSNSSPYLLRIENIKNTPFTSNFLIDSFYHSLDRNVFYSGVLNGASLTDNFILIYCLNSNYIYVYNKVNGSFNKKVKIESIYTKIGAAFEYIDSTFVLNSDKGMDIMRQSGFIKDVFYIPDKDLYAVVVLIEDPLGSHNERRPRQFSLILLDRNFSKVGERKFDTAKNYFGFFLNDNFYMYDVKASKKQNQSVFDIFSIQ